MYSSKFLDNSSRSSQAVLSSSEAQTDCANICHTWKTYLNSVQTNKRLFFFLRLNRAECLYTAYFDRNEGFYPHFDLKADRLFHSFMWIPTLVTCALLLLYSHCPIYPEWSHHSVWTFAMNEIWSSGCPLTSMQCCDCNYIWLLLVLPSIHNHVQTVSLTTAVWSPSYAILCLVLYQD